MSAPTERASAVPAHPFALAEKTVLVTGASSGIGRATAVELSRLGATVVLSGRREDALAETRAMLDEPERHAVEAFDLSDVDAIPAWVRGVVQRVGRPLDGLAHVAGVGGAMPLRALSRRSMEQVMVPNLYAGLALLRAVSAKGMATDGASLVLVSSVAGLAGSAGLVAYSATKGAVHAAVRSSAAELRGRRMRVNAVAPGYVDTPMLARSRDELPGFDEAVQRQFLGLPTPSEVALAIAYLLGDAARRVTGTVLVIDGGFTC